MNSRIQRVAPVLTVSSRTMVLMRDFFVNQLGFTIGTEAGNGPTFVTLDRDGQTVMLECKPTLIGPKKAWAAYFWVDDVDALHEELVARGTAIKSGIVDKNYGCRETVAVAPDGRQIVFGQLLSEVAE